MGVKWIRSQCSGELLDRGDCWKCIDAIKLELSAWRVPESNRGNIVFEGLSSPVIAEALNTGAGRVESLVLPHTYRHLTPGRPTAFASRRR
jgi:hypothetical protein